MWREFIYKYSVCGSNGCIIRRNISVVSRFDTENMFQTENFETEKIDVVPNKRFLVVVWLRSALALLL